MTPLISRARRAASSAVAALCVACVVAVPAAPARAATAGGPYDGYATGSVLHVDGITTASQRLADAELGVANAGVNSEGLQPVDSVFQRRVLPGAPSGARAGGSSSILEAGLGLMPVDQQNQLIPFNATAFSPSSNEKTDKAVLHQIVGPVAYADVLRNTAQTRWNADTCVVGAPIALGSERAAQLDLIETKDDPATPADQGFDAPVAAVDANAAGPRRGATQVTSLEQLFKGTGPGLGLYSVTAATLAPVTFFMGTPNEFTVEVDGPAYLRALADGTNGGAKVDFRAPVVSIIQGGKATTVLPSAPLTIRVPQTGDALASVKVGVMEPLPKPNGLGDATTTADGTRAAAVANIVEIQLLDTPDQPLKRGATIALGHMEARAAVPAGGISCPIPVTKSASPASVPVGNDFVTTITVKNPFACPLIDLKLDDDVTTESGALFEVKGTSPSADTAPSGSNLASGHLGWSLGTLAAGASKSVTVTMNAQGSAGRILDTATARGTLTNCPVSPADAGADVTGLANATVGVSGSASLIEPSGGTSVLGEQFHRPLPTTGVASRTPLAFVMFVLAAFLAVLTRRRARRV